MFSFLCVCLHIVRFHCSYIFFFSSRRRHTRCALVTGVQTCALPILIAFYEHRTFANAVLMEINPFDQWGVELGKEIARSVEAVLDGEEDGSLDPSTRMLVARALG